MRTLFVIFFSVLMSLSASAQLTLSSPVELRASSIGAAAPQGVAYHPGRNSIFILDDLGRVFEMDTAGRLLASFQTDATLGGGGLSYDPVTGELLLCQANRIFRLNPNGSPLQTIVDLTGSATAAEGVAVHPDTGNIWFVDDSLESIVEVSRGGTVLSEINTRNILPGLVEPTGLAFCDGNLLVTDDFNGTHTLYLVSTSGTLLQTVADTTSFGIEDPEGVTLAGPTVLWIASDRDSALYSFDLAGKVGAHQLYFAQFGNGGGLQSDIVLVNPSTNQSVSGQVDFFDQNGDPLTVDIDTSSQQGNLSAAQSLQPLAQQSSVSFEVGPSDSVTVRTTGVGASARVGSATVSSTGPLGGVVRFAVSVLDLGIVGVGDSVPVEGFIAPARRQGGSINTGVALHNPGNAPITLTLKLMSNGVQVAVRQLGLPGRGHVAQFIDELFGAAETDNFEGVLIATVNSGQVAATALEQGSGAGEFTALPVTPLN